MNPFTPFLKKAGVVILDGALATELERHGANLDDPLWSAKMLLEDPSLIRAVQRDYLNAGADVVTTATYQATFEGLAQRGLSPKECVAVFEKSVAEACRVRAAFWATPSNRTGRCRPLVAMSVGPYGAFLADGSEYKGDYGLSIDELVNFHRPGVAVLSKTNGSLFAFETIPDLREAEAIILLLAEFPQKKAWLSFSCRDDKATCSGDPIEACIRLIDQAPQIVATGFNCTAPEHIHGLLHRSAALTKKPLLAYPNRGELWDSKGHCWLPGTQDHTLAQLAPEWVKAGASAIGGCCRTSPSDIHELAITLKRGYTG